MLARAFYLTIMEVSTLPIDRLAVAFVFGLDLRV